LARQDEVHRTIEDKIIFFKNLKAHHEGLSTSQKYHNKSSIIQVQSQKCHHERSIIQEEVKSIIMTAQIMQPQVKRYHHERTIMQAQVKSVIMKHQ
jgi:hypothetical protein